SVAAEASRIGGRTAPSRLPLSNGPRMRLSGGAEDHLARALRCRLILRIASCSVMPVVHPPRPTSSLSRPKAPPELSAAKDESPASPTRPDQPPREQAPRRRANESPRRRGYFGG